jgi:hypothetical protein
MRGQGHDGPVVVVEGHAIDRRREMQVVLDLELQQAIVELGRGDARERVLADLDGECVVLGGDGHAVAPFHRPELEIDLHALLAALFSITGKIDDAGMAVLDGRQLGADQADQLPARVVGGERPCGHVGDQRLGQHRADQRVHGARRLVQGEH